MESMNFSAITCAVQFTPTTPTPLLPDAAMIPAVWVPWPSSSSGSFVLVTKFQPIRSSGWAVSPSWTLLGVGPAAGAGVVAVAVLDHRGEDVGGVDPAVAVDVGDLARPDVGRVVQVART